MAPDTDRSLASLLKDIAGNLQEIVRAEMRLARTEVRDELAKARRGAILIAMGGMLASIGTGLLFLAAVYALALVVPHWAAALIVAAAALAVGLGFVLAGSGSLRGINIAGSRTVSTIQENVQWAKTSTK